MFISIKSKYFNLQRRNLRTTTTDFLGTSYNAKYSQPIEKYQSSQKLVQRHQKLSQDKAYS